MNSNLTFWKKVGVVAGAIGAVLGVMIAWPQAEFLPRWAWHGEVQELQQVMQEQIASNQEFAQQTRILVLGQEWERLDQQISKLEEQGTLTMAERELLAKKRLRKSVVEQQLRELQEAQ